MGEVILKKLTIINLYRFCILPIYLMVVSVIPRIQLAVSLRSLTYLFRAKFGLVSKRMGFSQPSKIFILQSRQIVSRLINKLTDEGEKIQAVFEYLKRRKSRALSLPWLFPEEAWLSPALDCKAFSVLMLELLKGVGIKSELWIGLSSREGTGHAWLEVQVKGRRRVFDRDCRQVIPAEEYRRIHPYTLVTRIA